MAKALGKGLGALIKTYGSDVDKKTTSPELSIKKIILNKSQPRNKFNISKMDSLTKSISEKGILQPLTVRKNKNDQFELIAGERRLRAAIRAGLSNVPVYIINITAESEMLELALIENIQRVDLNPMEEAEGYAVLRGKYGFTQSKIANSISKSRSEIANKLRLLKLPPVIQESLKNGKIEYGHARALLSFRESSIMLTIHKKIIKNNLNVRQTELLTRSTKNKKEKPQLKKFADREEKLQTHLKTAALIYKKPKQKGKIIITFSNQSDLDRILNKIYE